MTQLLGPRARSGVVAAVTVVWAANMIATVFTAHDPPESVHSLFMAIVGALMLAGKNDDGGTP